MMGAETAAQKSAIDQLIINSPYEEPAEHWKYHRETRKFSREKGRRPAGYIRASESSRAFDDPGEFVPLPLVNQIRPRVKAWREANYPGVTGITKRLLEHWRDPEQRENKRLFFCQLEAMETLIWLTEAPASERVGVEVPSDTGPFVRICSKMATGSGKTIVMAMLIAWQILNKVTYPQDKRFSKHVFVVAPGLTVKSRLQVLTPSGAGNYYSEFGLIPPGLEDKLRQGKVKIRNWHALDWESEAQIAKKKGVDKRGALSDEAYVREVLEEMASAQNIAVINDEAHHAWRVPPKVRVAGVPREELKKATKWVGGLDRIQRSRGILTCFDLTATPFALMGLRAFTSQLLCEQVVGRGLRRTSYDVNPQNGLFEAEYVNIFGVPFTFLPHESSGDGPIPPPPSPKTRIEPDPTKRKFEIRWPNVMRVDHEYRLRLALDAQAVPPLALDAMETPLLAELAPILEGKPDARHTAEIRLSELAARYRMQKVVFETAARVYAQMRPTWKGDAADLLAQVIRIVEDYIESERITISPPLFAVDDLRRRLVYVLNMTKIVQHIWQAIRAENAESLVAVFDTERPIRATGDMLPWYTGKPCEHVKRSHINQCVFDSTWEATESVELDRNENVEAWVKNDHVGFEILYLHRGIIRKYHPDYLVRLKNGTMLVLEVKGQDTEESKTKRDFLEEWVRAVNQNGGFGRWAKEVSYHAKDVAGLLQKHSSS